MSSIYSSWNVSNCPSSHDQRCEVTNIHDNSSSQYHIYVYDSPDLTSCTFFNQLIIFNVSEEQNNTDYTCIESNDEDGTQPIFPQDNTTSKLSEYYKYIASVVLLITSYSYIVLGKPQSLYIHV